MWESRQKISNLTYWKRLNSTNFLSEFRFFFWTFVEWENFSPFYRFFGGCHLWNENICLDFTDLWGTGLVEAFNGMEKILKMLKSLNFFCENPDFFMQQWKCLWPKKQVIRHIWSKKVSVLFSMNFSLVGKKCDSKFLFWVNFRIPIFFDGVIYGMKKFFSILCGGK